MNNATRKVPSSAILQKLFDSLHEIVCALDAEGRFVYVNQAVFKILGYHPEELIGVSCFDLMVEEDRQASFRATRDAYAGGDIPVYENRYYRKDGSIATMFWEGGWDFGDQLIYSTGKDISEQRRFEKLEQEYQAELQHTKEQLERLLDRIADGFMGLDEDARVIYWNRAAERIADLSAARMVGHILWDVLPEPTLSLAKEQYKRLKAQNRPLSIEYFSKRINRWIEVNAYVSGSGISVFFRDVTERKELQEQLIQQKEQQQKRITAAVIKATEEERAHVGKELHDNVNQVLTTVKLYAELCLTNPANREELLKRSAQLLQVTINEIRGLSKRLSAPALGGIKLKDSVSELIAAIKAASRFDIRFKHNAEELEVTDDVHIAVYRILQEHFTNIIKHANASNVVVRMKVEGVQLKVTVSDDGQGFDVAQKRTGIGIENMISRAEALNGTLRLISAPGQGCTLQLTIPLKSGT